MTDALYEQVLATTTGLLLLTAILQVWGRSLRRSIGLLVLQGAALAGLALTVGVRAGEPEAWVVAALILAVKSVAMPWAMVRTASVLGERRERGARLGTGLELLGAAALTLLAYAVSGPLQGTDPDLAARAVPVGLSLVLLGFWLLFTRASAVTQLVGFLLLDNGIATVAFLTSGGLPVVIELGVSLDVLLVVLILGVLAVRLRRVHGHSDVAELRELHD